MKWLLLWSLAAGASPPGAYLCFDGGKQVDRESMDAVSDAERSCKAIDDCTFLHDTCQSCAVAVNKISKAAVETRILKHQSEVRCRTGGAGPAIPYCRNGQCAVRRVRAEKEAACRRDGGRWAGSIQGRGRQWGCIYPTADAGKSCRDGKECDAGRCVAVSDEPPGKCYGEDFSPKGCDRYFVDGKLKTICLD